MKLYSEMIFEQNKNRGEQVALVDRSGHRETFRSELARMAYTVANHARRCALSGVVPVRMGRSAETVAVLLGLNLAGIGVAPLSENTPSDEEGHRVLLHTGDIVRRLPDGNYRFLSRKVFMLKINAQRVESGEAETALKQIEGIRDAVVKGFEEKGRTYLCAYYASERELNADELWQKLSEKLPSYMIPSHYVHFETSPREGICTAYESSPADSAIACKEFVQPFSLFTGPLCRARAYITSEKAPAAGACPVSHRRVTLSLSGMQSEFRKNNLTESSFFMSVFGYVLAKMTGQTESLFTAAESGRKDSRTDNTVSMFSRALLDKLYVLNPSLHIINGYGPSEATITCSCKRLTPEEPICAVPGVRNAVVVVRGENENKYLAAYYTAERRLPSETVMAEISEKLARYMVPRVYMQLAAMPMTAHGKINRKALSDIQSEKRPGGAAAVTDTEKLICQLFCAVLKTEHVFADDNFFELGGNSLAASGVVMQMKSKGYQLEYQTIFDHQTPRELAAFPGDADGEETAEQLSFDDKGNPTDPALRELLKYNTLPYAAEAERKPLGDVLMTGAVGFLGIHVLSALLQLKTIGFFDRDNI